MDEHLALLDLAADVRTALGRGDRADALARLRKLGVLLDRHVRREERGVFADEEYRGHRLRYYPVERPAASGGRQPFAATGVTGRGGPRPP